ncbi:hypothetical protein BCR32DRAFT_325234 [Anaeromyces robustus]|uniref:DUF1648 domain-containing protein n=1 Tax=Anaeromyces robustus TaxID=1754192 RepID=A0A1Y1XJP0_9FUNG|nr:hypothetical protein BCR32DRAFT_325234 [Anaeromyces robustus]|eukprot:ORX85932.1 hypothetical protein BCR32DRAFT_325234 [Anaeromyces robustus]
MDLKLITFFGINISVIIFMLGDLFLRWKEIPDVIPSSFNIKGEAKGERSKMYLFLLPSLSFCVLALLIFVNIKFPVSFYPDEIKGIKDEVLKRQFERSTKIFLLILGFIYNVLMCFINISMSHSRKLNVVPLVAITILVVAIIGKYSDKVEEFVQSLQKKDNKKDKKDTKKADKQDKKDSKKDNETKKSK